MKINQKLIQLACLLIVIFIFVIKTFTFNYPKDDFYNGYYQINRSKIDLLNDSLQEARQKLNQLENRRYKYVDGNEDFSWTSGSSLGYGKLSGNESKDNMFLITKAIKLDLSENVSKHYLQYYTEKGQGYLSRLKFIKRKEADSVVYVDQKVGFKYFSKQGMIAIQLNSTIAKLTVPCVSFILIGFDIFLLLFVIYVFLSFLSAISKNEIFDLKNVNRLKRISYALFILAFFPLLIEGITYLIFVLNYGNAGILFNYSFWERGCYWLVGSAIIYLIYIAFKRGMELQQERDLTI
ncbi:DUF2975 domain-containing protein [Pedobacter sp. UC225_65]|uniref:DUF2975 domain-containing protein n=1 Tax=Pedobacter sp. UC225_65 TaxID=3350173 RepID=UPI00366F1890